MARLTFTIIVGLFSSLAFGDIAYQKFSPRADSTFTLNILVDGVPVTIKSTLRDGEIKSSGIQQGRVTAYFHSYTEGFVTIAIVVENRDLGAVFVMERQNADMILLNDRSILGRAALTPDGKQLLFTDLENIVDDLKNYNSWDASIALRAMVDFFKRGNGPLLGDFYDQVELRNVKLISKPQPKNGPGHGQTVRTPTMPAHVSPVSETRPQESNAPVAQRHEDSSDVEQVGHPSESTAVAARPLDRSDDVGPGPRANRAAPTSAESAAHQKEERMRRRARALARQRAHEQAPSFMAPSQGFQDPNDYTPPRTRRRQPGFFEQLFGR